MSEAEFDLELIERYGGRGPRYTSYPTAVQFQTGFGPADYQAEVIRSDSESPTAPLSIYLHIPFCRSLCFYCGCSKIVTRNRGRADEYLALLFREIELQAPLFREGRLVEQLHLGGGTPTYLESHQLQSLMTTLGRHFGLRTDERREFSIEVDPRTVSPGDIGRLAELGFNRISMGVQDFDVEVQKAINRIQTAEATQALVEAARAVSFRSVSLDLIYGLPLQTVESFDETLTQVLGMRPDRLAVYSYAHLPQLFRSQKLIAEDQLPAPAVRLEILRHTIGRLTAAGYVYIGMDHFALADDELVTARARGELQRNFQGYSTHGDADLVALGVTAIGQVGNCYAQNAKDLGAYRSALDQGRLPIARGLLMNADDRLRRAIIQEIMCQGHLNFEAVCRGSGVRFQDYFASELQALRQLERDGLIESDDTGLTVTGRGRLLLRAIAMVFDRYLPSNRPAQGFSRVV
jgi:oxygen-independent coproporphyrinogen-3 oxidase